MSYTIYTTAHDEVIHASTFMQDLGNERLAQHQIAWNTLMSVFDTQEKGAASSPDLSGFAKDGDPVTLLLDCSGSQRGRRAGAQVLALRTFGDAMQAAGLPFRILGHTTRAWKGGEPQSEWKAAGRPASPGRLNELRHVVFHTPEDNWEASKESLSLMTMEGFGKENIDGEALEWAASVSGAGRLIVFTDGVPADVASMNANAGTPHFLTDHRNEVIRNLADAGRETAFVFIGNETKELQGLESAIADIAPVFVVDMPRPQEVLDAVMSAITAEVPAPKPATDTLGF